MKTGMLRYTLNKIKARVAKMSLCTIGLRVGSGGMAPRILYLGNT